MPEFEILDSCSAMRDWTERQRKAGRTIAVVPTMGALHEGHLSLVRAARRAADCLLVTIFVNPTQFGAGEDLDRYPRTWEADIAALTAEHVDGIFAPASDAMYPAGFSTYVEPPAVAQPLEGEFRPGHFRGVTTVVLKLLLLTQPQVAIFGQKDYQQALVIRRMVADLNVPVEIRVEPIVREADGLAMSSRNRYLQPAERAAAGGLSRALTVCLAAYRQGERCPETLENMLAEILRQAGVTAVDYARVVDAETLQPVSKIAGPAVALIAARVGATRLIDNQLLDEDLF